MKKHLIRMQRMNGKANWASDDGASDLCNWGGFGSIDPDKYRLSRRRKTPPPAKTDARKCVEDLAKQPNLGIQDLRLCLIQDVNKLLLGMSIVKLKVE